MKFKETFVKKQFSFKGSAVGFRIDKIRLPNGKQAIREYLDHPGAVALVAVTDKNKILFVRQFRYPVKQVTCEIPAGKLDGQENIRLCALRELEEETGYRTKRLRKLITFWPTAAFGNEVIHIFIADRLKPGTNNPDEDEFLDCFELSIEEAVKAIRSGKIRDSKTIIGILAYKELLHE